MKYFFLILMVLQVLVPTRVAAQAEVAMEAEDSFALRDSEEREHIRQTRASEQAKFTAQEAQCYARFAVNNCLGKVRAERREVLTDLRRQEISLNDAQRKRRGAEQLLRSDERSSRTQ